MLIEWIKLGSPNFIARKCSRSSPTVSTVLDTPAPGTAMRNYHWCGEQTCWFSNQWKMSAPSIQRALRYENYNVGWNNETLLNTMNICCELWWRLNRTWMLGWVRTRCSAASASFSLIWITKTFIFDKYLINGTGNAWAWHSKAKLECSFRTKMLPLESVENVGALAPTGSIKSSIILFYK